MDSRFKELELTQEQYEDLAGRLGVVINDEIENLDAIFAGYGSSEYVKAAAEEVKLTSIKIKVLEFLKQHGISLINGFAILRRRAAVSTSLGHTFLATKITAIGEGVNEVTLEHTVCNMDIPADQYKAAKVVTIPSDGVYQFIKLEGILVVNDVKEDEPKEEEVKEEETPTEEIHEEEVVTPEITD